QVTRHPSPLLPSFLFFLHATSTSEIYTLSLHDALPISHRLVEQRVERHGLGHQREPPRFDLLDVEHLVDEVEQALAVPLRHLDRSEEHTSELQSLAYLVCRLLLEKKKHNASMSRLMALA